MGDHSGSTRIRAAMFKHVLVAMENVLLSAKCAQDDGAIYSTPIVLEDLFTSINTVLFQDEELPFDPQQRQIINIAQSLAQLLERMQGIRLRVVSQEENIDKSVTTKEKPTTLKKYKKQIVVSARRSGGIESAATSSRPSLSPSPTLQQLQQL
ncbi:hypothetical protein PFISCL1PPCAC_16408, partial [Pristionchus fissidentatus]